MVDHQTYDMCISNISRKGCLEMKKIHCILGFAWLLWGVIFLLSWNYVYLRLLGSLWERVGTAGMVRSFVLLEALGVLFIASGYYLTKRKRWAWIAVFCLSVIGIILSGLTLMVYLTHCLSMRNIWSLLSLVLNSTSLILIILGRGEIWNSKSEYKSSV